MIAVEGLSARYGARIILSDVSFQVASGEVLAILGANGSGKSTLLRALAGVLPHGGQVRRPDGPVGYMPQDNATQAALSVFEVVLLGRMRSLGLRVAAEDLAAAEAALAEIGIAGLARQRIGTLSGGQRQMVYLAQVLAAAPATLLLDEPSSALDIAHQLHVLALIRATTRRRGLSTVVVLHDINAAARFADRIAVLAGGALAAIGPAESVLTPPLLREAYGVEVAIQPGPDGKPVVIALQAAAPA